MYHMEETNKPELVAFDKWINEVGRSPTTAWRWRKRGWISTLNISGRVYVHRDEIDRFTARARSGEFAKAVKVPRGEGGAQ